MNVGELFVNLGVKGTDKTISAFAQVKTGLSDMASMSLEAKAGIVGALYALEQLMSKSGSVGTNLTNFSALTGQNVKMLQQWQYAARQVGASNQEMESSFKGVQNAMTGLLLTGEHSADVAFIASKVGFDITKARDTEYVLKQFQKFAQAVPPDMARKVLGGFGLSDNIIAGMRQNIFRPDVFAKAPTYSEKEISALNRANIAWSNLATKIEMAVGHFNAMHGGQLVKDISMLTDKVLLLAEAFLKLAETVKLFKVIGTVFEGWAKIFGTSSNEVNTVRDLLNPKTRGKAESEIKDNLSAVPGALKLMAQDFMSGKMGENIINGLNLYFNHDGKDHQKTQDSVQKGIKGAFRQMPAQRGGY